MFSGLGQGTIFINRVADDQGGGVTFSKAAGSPASGREGQRQLVPDRADDASDDAQRWGLEDLEDWLTGDDEEAAGEPSDSGETPYQGGGVITPDQEGNGYAAPAASCPNPWLYAAGGAALGLAIGLMAGKKKKRR